MVKLDIYGQNLQFPIADEEFSCCLAYVLFGTRSLALRSLFTRFIKKMCACIFGIFYSYLYPRCGAVNGCMRLWSRTYDLYISKFLFSGKFVLNNVLNIVSIIDVATNTYLT